MGLFDSIFGSKEKGGGFKEIPLSESQKFSDQWLWDLLKRIETFAPRQIAGLTPAERGAVGIAEKTVSGGIPGVSEARQALTKRMTGAPEQVPGLKGLFAKTRELGANLMGSTKRGLAMTGNLPSESSRGERIYGRTLQDIMEGLVTAAFPFYSQGLAAKLAAPGELANLGMQDVSMRTGIGTTVGALPRQIEQSIFDAILEAVRTTQTFPYQAQAPIAQNIMGQTRYGYQPPTISPSIFSQIAGPAAQVASAYFSGGGAGNVFAQSATGQGVPSASAKTITGTTPSGGYTFGSGGGGGGKMDAAQIAQLAALAMQMFSDARIKENVKPIDSALDKITKLTGYSYNYTFNSPDNRTGGIMAQDLEEVLPDAVSEINGVKFVRYDAVIALLVNAVKELAEKAA